MTGTQLCLMQHWLSIWGGDEMGWSASVGLQPNQETPWANQLHIGDGECLHCVLQ
jgi:hypothetical protein